MALGCAGSAADAVPAGASAQQDHHVAALRPLTHHILCRSRRHHRAALQPLGHIAVVIYLRHMAGSQTDLVAVGGIARRRRLGDAALGQLARQGLVQCLAGVAAAGHPHGLMDIRTARQRITDAPADAGGRAARYRP